MFGDFFNQRRCIHFGEDPKKHCLDRTLGRIPTVSCVEEDTVLRQDPDRRMQLADHGACRGPGTLQQGDA